MNLPPIRPIAQWAVLAATVSGLAFASAGVGALSTQPTSSSTAEPDSAQVAAPAGDAIATAEPAVSGGLVDPAAPAGAIGAAPSGSNSDGDTIASPPEAGGIVTPPEAGGDDITTTSTTEPVSSTTTTGPDGTTTTTGPTGTDPEPEVTTTTTTPVPEKQWVVVARYHTAPGNFNIVDAPAQFPVELETGELRVNGVDNLPVVGRPGYVAVWFGTSPDPMLCGADGPIIALTPGRADCPVAPGPHPTGPQVLSIGQQWVNLQDSSVMWRAPYVTSGDVVVEEYR